jgi:hypothetical protein
VFANGGRVALSAAAIPDEKNRKAEFTGPSARRVGVALRSAWEK